MKNWPYDGKRFKNGNLNIRFSPEEIAEVKKRGHESFLLALLDKLDRFDTSIIGEDYNLSNYDTGATAYSFYADKSYIISWRMSQDMLMSGKTYKLIAIEPNEMDREILEEEYGYASA